MAQNHEDHELVKYGRPYSHERSGPMWRKHSCTDVPCLFIFMIFLGGWAFIAQYAVRNGDLNKLMLPTDSFNQKCGIDSGVLGKKYLFFFNLEKCIDPLVPLTGCPTPQVCVENCPSETFVWDSMKNEDFSRLKPRLICLTDAIKRGITNKQQAQLAIDRNECARYYIKSAPFLNRCMWQFSPQVCDYIPSFLLKQRTRRDGSKAIDFISNANATIITANDEPQLQAMALSMEKYVAAKVDSKLALQEEPQVQCKRRTELGETVIREKMIQTDTRLAKLVGNFVAHFYNGTHDAQQLGEAIVEDIFNSWFVIFMALVCTLLVSLIFIFLMRWLAAPVLWFSILGVLLGLLVGIYYSIRQYQFWRDTPTVPNHGLNLHSAVKNILQEPSNWLYLIIAECICFLVIFLLVIVLRTRISIAIALTKEGSKAVSSVYSTVFFPIFSWVLFIAAILYAIGVGLYLGSIGEPAFRMIKPLTEQSSTTNMENCICGAPVSHYKIGDTCDPKLFQQHCYSTPQRAPCSQTSCSFTQLEHPSIVNWFIVYNVFGYLWLTFFISAFNDMVLAGTFANWYWCFKKKDLPYFTLTKSFAQTFFYHLGTLAFGSLILAICRLIRLILEYIHSKLIKYDNAVTRAILCCMRCFFWLLETFLKFLNRNAYIMCAIHGKNFCTSAQDAFNLIMRNFLRVITLDKVTDFLFFLSKVLLTGAAGTATYYFVSTSPLIQLHYAAVPTTIVVIAAFLITSVFFGVYSMAVDTLFLCFLEDCERNDGTPEKPYYMSKQLMRILGKRNKMQRQFSNESNK